MDLSNILGMITGVLPYISYIVNLFTKLIELVSSYLGVDITIPTTTVAEETVSSEDEAVSE